MRSLSLLCLAIVIVIQQSPAKGKTQHSKPDKINQSSAENNKIAPIPDHHNQEPGEQTQCAINKPSFIPSRSWWPITQWDATQATIGLFIVGALGMLSALITIVVIKRQTGAIQIQSTAVMDADSALLLIMWENIIHIDPEAPNGVLHHCFNWTVRNIGKTPAFIQRVHGRFVVIKSLSDLPPEPAYLKPKELIAEPLLPGINFEPNIYSPIESATPYEELERQHRAKECFLYAYGFVAYLDIYQRPQETRFGLIYNSQPEFNMAFDRFSMDGPPAYNRYRQPEPSWYRRAVKLLRGT